MKYCTTIIFLLFTFFNIAQGQKKEFSNDFESESQIRNYLTKNVVYLDPIEGEYDVESSGEYITPFVHQYYPKSSSKAFIVGNGNKFDVYFSVQGDFGTSVMRVETIGETNAYRMFFHTSYTRIYLQNNNHFNASFKLDNTSAKKYTKNPNLSTAVTVILYNDFIKIYPTQEMYANAAREIMEAQPREWTGTGFALTNNYIVTNNHVVDGAKTIFIQGVNGDFNQKYYAEVVKTDKINDIAIIKVNGVNIPSVNIPYAVKTNTAEVGEEVFVLGYPLTSTMGEEIKLTTGVVSSKTGFQGDVSIYQISAPIQPGNSGGPLFDSKGNVIGIVSAKHRGAENVGYAIKASYLKNLMESTLSTNILPKTNKIASLNLSGKVKSVKNYIYYITCSSKDKSSSYNNIENESNNTYIAKSATFKASYRKQGSGNLIINKIEINNEYTALYCQYTNREYDFDGWYSMEAGTCIIDKMSGKKYKLKNTDNCAISPQKTSIKLNETKRFVLYFPPIPITTKEIDFVESINSTWNKYGIKLIKE